MKTLILAGVAFAALLAGPAVAADMRVGAPVYKAPSPAAFSWTGCYVGIEGGGNWGKSQHFENEPGARTFGLAQTAGIDLSGALLGGTVGCSYQFGNWAIGFENDLSWTNKKGSAGLIPPFVATDTFQTSESWLDTLRGRLGFAWDRWFIYGTGGAAFANEGIELCDPFAGCGNLSKTVTGWTAGAGVEYAFSGDWSLKLEYLHVDLGTQSYPNIYPGGIFANGGDRFAQRNVSLTDDIVRAGMNYKFSWGSPVAAKY
jgi:outer membrane immunogenic protein